jgi:hypothetical protein
MDTYKKTTIWLVLLASIIITYIIFLWNYPVISFTIYLILPISLFATLTIMIGRKELERQEDREGMTTTLC